MTRVGQNRCQLPIAEYCILIMTTFHNNIFSPHTPNDGVVWKYFSRSGYGMKKGKDEGLYPCEELYPRITCKMSEQFSACRLSASRSQWPPLPFENLWITAAHLVLSSYRCPLASSTPPPPHTHTHSNTPILIEGQSLQRKGRPIRSPSEKREMQSKRFTIFWTEFKNAPAMSQNSSKST